MRKPVALPELYYYHGIAYTWKLWIQINWLQKPTDLDLHCFPKENMYGFSRAWAKTSLIEIAGRNWNATTADKNSVLIGYLNATC